MIGEMRQPRQALLIFQKLRVDISPQCASATTLISENEREIQPKSTVWISVR